MGWLMRGEVAFGVVGEGFQPGSFVSRLLQLRFCCDLIFRLLTSKLCSGDV